MNLHFSVFLFLRFSRALHFPAKLPMFTPNSQTRARPSMTPRTPTQPTRRANSMSLVSAPRKLTLGKTNLNLQMFIQPNLHARTSSSRRTIWKLSPETLRCSPAKLNPSPFKSPSVLLKRPPRQPSSSPTSPTTTRVRVIRVIILLVFLKA